MKKNFLPSIFIFQKGVITTYVLVFGSIFLILLGGLLGFILFQFKQLNQKIVSEQSFHIAEAGLNYYQWCANNEVEQNCQTEKDYYDFKGNFLGHFSLEIMSQEYCGQSIQKKVISTGWTNKFPEVRRKIVAFYAQESAARYSYIINDNVWVGPDYEIRGPFHSNGGIRMDGENQSAVTSAAENWICTKTFGCGPLGFPGEGLGLGMCPENAGCRVENKECICPGIFTTTDNSKSDLFSFPISPFDFNSITIDLAQMKNVAQNIGIYFPPSKNINSQGKGWHLEFKPDGTFEAWIITSLSSSYAYSIEEDWHYDYFTIKNEYLYNVYTIPSACSVIFVEDNLWPEGVIKGKVSLASANFTNPNLETDVILQGNIDYSIKDGSDGLTLIGQRNILIGPDSPETMELKGIFVAQKGRFGRNHYPKNSKEKLVIYGSVISNSRVGTQWISGSQIVSGYLERESYFDANLIYSPPMFTPVISSDFKLIDWHEIK